MKRIICIGNPLVEDDSAGHRVYLRLRGTALPPEVQVVDGGVRGIDLLPLVAASERVAFVDSVSGFAEPGEVVALDAAALEEAEPAPYDHAGGFAYLLRSLPHLVRPPVPLCLIGLEGRAGDAACAEAARLALAFVTQPAGAGA